MKLPIAVLPGDGIGPEVTAEAVRVLTAIASKFDHELEMTELPFGSKGMEVAGSGFPDETRRACLESKAILLGAVGDPAWDHLPPTERPEAALLELRRLLGSFANLRPVLTQHWTPSSPFQEETVKGVDLLIVRELTGGLYFGEPRGVETMGDDGQQRAWNTLVYRSSEVERVARVGFEAAQKRRKRVTSVDKANVLETSRLWRQVVDRVAADYPEVALTHMYVDRAAMELVQNPKGFDVLLTGNLFGDILSDEASVLAGSLGLLPSASIGGEIGLYEPVHGAAPDIAGQGIANPLGAIASAAMLLRYSFGLVDEARQVERAIGAAFDAGRLTGDLVANGQGATTTEVGEFVAEQVIQERSLI